MLLSHWQVKHIRLKYVDGRNLTKQYKKYREYIKIALTELWSQFYNVCLFPFVFYTNCSVWWWPTVRSKHVD